VWGGGSITSLEKMFHRIILHICIDVL